MPVERLGPPGEFRADPGDDAVAAADAGGEGLRDELVAGETVRP
ncbi:hypothetical protein ACIA8I_25340 [Streptomyces rishiriensis]